LNNLDRAIEVEKQTTKETLKDIDFKKAKKDYDEKKKIIESERSEREKNKKSDTYSQTSTEEAPKKKSRKNKNDIESSYSATSMSDRMSESATSEDDEMDGGFSATSADF